MDDRKDILIRLAHQIDGLSQSATIPVATRKAYLLGYVKALLDSGAIPVTTFRDYVERIERVHFTD